MRLVCIVALSVVPALLLGAAAAGIEDGRAEGQLTVGGKPVKLTHAYAVAQKGFFDPKKDDVMVILADVPLDQKAVADDFARIALAKEGKLHSVEVVLNANKQPISVSIRHQALKYPQSGGSTEDAFEAQVFDGKVVAGRVFRRSPGSSFDDIPFTYDVTFRAVVAPKAK
jgi:hypothetical protein